MNPLRPAILATLLTTPVMSGAADNPGSHQHGAAQLQLAMDGEHIDLLLLSPAHNLLGFEHAPENEEQRAQVAALVEWMKSTPLVQAQGNACRLESASVVAGNPGRSGQHGGGHHEGDYAEHYREHHGEYPDKDHHGHHGKHHDDGHHGGKHGEHDDHHGHHKGDNDGHSDVEVTQTLKCDGLEADTELTTALISEYPGIEQLDVQWVGAGGQGAVRLVDGRDSFRLTE